ncbi:MAG: methylmalonyl-CoA mutase small subunit [Tannerella sp.]|jgi:methylmalonyl-CoA mutase|nr:methylmalonyl-CoA mutase small subunit [Tannerella sp.]
MAEAKESLFSEFPPVSAQEWTDKITADLKGAPFDKKMIWKTGEGFDVNPFYTAEDIEGLAITKSLPGEFPYVRGTKISNKWLVRQDIDVTDFKAANEKARKLIAEGGVTSLGFSFNGEQVTEANIAALLDGICPEKTELNFHTCNRKAVELLDILTVLYKTKGADPDECSGSVAFNPLKHPLKRGIKLGDDWVDKTVAVLKAGEGLPHYRLLAVDAYLLNDAGAYITQELGYALANGNDLIAKLIDAGVPADVTAKKIKFNFGVSSNYFMEIAKFRAARWLWAEIVGAYNPVCDCPTKNADSGDFCPCACKMKAHARTSEWNLTVFDAYVNLLRTQTETMSAAIAGVDSISVLPFDSAFKASDEFSERIAKNQQLLLKEECHFDEVVDASAGSYYIEELTQSLAEAAWKLFLEVDDKGGFATIANSGEVQDAVNASNKARKKLVATRRLTLLGTNQYPNFSEQAGNKIEAPTECDCSDAPAEISKLDFSRGSAEFDALRLATEKSGKRPKAFMLTIGSLAMRLARSQFASNFFACAGYEVIDNLGFETVEEGILAAREKKADIVVICSSDDEYATLAPEAYKLIAGKELFVVAGAPECTDDLKALGINYFINVKSNVLETLQMFNKIIGI